MNECLHRFGRLRHDYGRSQRWLPAKQAYIEREERRRYASSGPAEAKGSRNSHQTTGTLMTSRQARMQRATPRWSGCVINCNMVQPGGNRCAKGAQAVRVAGHSNTTWYSSPRARWVQCWHSRSARGAGRSGVIACKDKRQGFGRLDAGPGRLLSGFPLRARTKGRVLVGLMPVQGGCSPGFHQSGTSGPT